MHEISTHKFSTKAGTEAYTHTEKEMAGNQGGRSSCDAGIWMGLIMILLVAQALVAEVVADD